MLTSTMSTCIPHKNYVLAHVKMKYERCKDTLSSTSHLEYVYVSHYALLVCLLLNFVARIIRCFAQS